MGVETWQLEGHFHSVIYTHTAPMYRPGNRQLYTVTSRNGTGNKAHCSNTHTRERLVYVITLIRLTKYWRQSLGVRGDEQVTVIIISRLIISRQQCQVVVAQQLTWSLCDTKRKKYNISEHREYDTRVYTHILVRYSCIICYENYLLSAVWLVPMYSI